jgi:hypothetical protein
MKYAIASSSINGNKYGLYFDNDSDYVNWVSYGEIHNLFKRIDIKVHDLTTILYDNSFKRLRFYRNQSLRETDFTQLADAPIDNKLKSFYRLYRKYLRDLPSNFNSETVKEAKVMNFKEWKDWFFPEH